MQEKTENNTEVTTMNQIRILSIEGKDLLTIKDYLDYKEKYISTKSPEDKEELEFEVCTKNKVIKDSRLYKNTVDSSLAFLVIKDVIDKNNIEKLKENTEAKLDELLIELENEKIATDIIVNVSFEYGMKEYEKSYSKKLTKYVVNGYDDSADDYSCGISISRSGILKGVIVGKQYLKEDVDKLLSDKQCKLPNFVEVLEEDSMYVFDVDREKIKTIVNKEEVRKNLYEIGAKIKGRKYVRFLRSSGASRNGKCLFIREDMYESVMNKLLMGLKFEKDKEYMLSSVEAYVALASSSIIDTMEIKPENILLIEDIQSVFKDKVISVYQNEGTNKLETRNEETEIENDIFDGQALMDISLFRSGSNNVDYEEKGMLLLRNLWTKTCAFNCNIQEFFKDNDIKSIAQLNGKTIAKRVEDIKLILTPNSIKYLKFGEWEDYIGNLPTTWGVVKYEKPPKNFDGKLVLTSYQFLNTLQLSKNEVELLLKDSIDYVNGLKKETALLKQHIGVKSEDDDFLFSSFKSKYEVVKCLLSANDDFARTDFFFNFRKDIVDAYVKHIRSGHIYVNGNYSVLCGNGIEMLKSSILEAAGKALFDIEKDESILNVDEIYCKRFADEQELTGVRSPHITMSNLWLCKNKYSDKIDKYFNSSNEIVHVNSIGSNILEKLNSADFDSDSLLLTDNEVILKSVKKNYKRFLVPVNKVPSTIKKRTYTNESKADLDAKTGQNSIGEIVNVSQVLNSKIWHMVNSNESEEKIQSLYEVVCKLAVMSCLEIDSAKKEFDIDLKKELDDIREEHMDIAVKREGNKKSTYYYPNYFKAIGADSSKKFKKYNTAMETVQAVMSKNVQRAKRRQGVSSILQFITFFSEDIKVSGANKDLVKGIFKKSFKLNQKTRKIFASNIEGKEKYDKVHDLRTEFNIYLRDKKITPQVMKKILSDISKETHRDRSNKEEGVNKEKIWGVTYLISALYEEHTEVFKAILKENKKPGAKLIKLESSDTSEEDDNIINVYGEKYKVS